MESPPPKPKRRLRYKGKHPRSFHEKYKELNPDKYPDDIKKIMERGSTPVGSHRPICVDEILSILKPAPGETALDATLGYGGHTESLLKHIIPGGKLIGLDRDPLEGPKTEARLRLNSDYDRAFIMGPVNFSSAKVFLNKKNIKNVDMVLADLGLSSMQIDNPKRGFTFKKDGPFDLRMNPKEGEPAYELLARLSQAELQKMLIDYADEPHARQIAQMLIMQKPKTTLEVAEAVRAALAKLPKHIQNKEGDTPIRRVFQALRITINGEFEALDNFLADIPEYLDRGGRVAILSFHSGEDRRVKKAFQAGHKTGFYREVSDGPIRASFQEQKSNPRSKSAKLRWAKR